MKKTVEERVRHYLLTHSGKNKFSNGMSVILIQVVTFISRFFNYCLNNTKRLIVLFLSIFMAGIFSSISFWNLSSYASEEAVVNINSKDTGLFLSQDEDQIVKPITYNGFATEDSDDDYLEVLPVDDGMSELEYTEYYAFAPMQTVSASDALVMSDFSKDDWRLILINKTNPIPEDYTFEL
ncbi:MAG: hypothetical protein K6F84_06480, partial [Lachnospiraceae bacterium]|nr:hypothetical protein [Lachnospiraceae bacterium]